MILPLLLLMAAGPQPMPLSLSDASRAVVLLHGSSPKGELVGTGFLVQLPDALYLVTAAHVAEDIGDSPQLTYAGEADTATTKPLSLVAGTKAIAWTQHPQADVAVLHLHGDPTLVAALRLCALQPPHLIANLEAPARERPLTIMGFPLGIGALTLGPDKKISAISRETHAASGLITLPRADTKKPANFFLLQDPSVGGFSGTPVFLLPSTFNSNGALVFSDQSGFCVGLVHGTISDETGGKLGAVVPVAYIAETLQIAYDHR